MSILHKYNDLSKIKKILVGAGGMAVMAALFVIFVFNSKMDEINSLNEKITGLQSEIGINTKKAQNLNRLKEENKQLKQLLQTAKAQLPQEDEISGLLKQISDIGINTGLDFKLWRPKNKVVQEGKMYIELPVEVEVNGDYHSVGAFFDKVSRISRIVNISKINMGSAIEKKGKKVNIRTTFTATAFALAKQDENKE